MQSVFLIDGTITFYLFLIWFKVNKVGLQIRAALITSVYHKTMVVKATGLFTFSTGEVFWCHI